MIEEERLGLDQTMAEWVSLADGASAGFPTQMLELWLLKALSCPFSLQNCPPALGVALSGRSGMDACLICDISGQCPCLKVGTSVWYQ